MMGISLPSNYTNYNHQFVDVSRPVVQNHCSINYNKLSENWLDEHSLLTKTSINIVQLLTRNLRSYFPHLEPFIQLAKESKYKTLSVEKFFNTLLSNGIAPQSLMDETQIKRSIKLLRCYKADSIRRMPEIWNYIREFDNSKFHSFNFDTKECFSMATVWKLNAHTLAYGAKFINRVQFPLSYLSKLTKLIEKPESLFGYSEKSSNLEPAVILTSKEIHEEKQLVMQTLLSGHGLSNFMHNHSKLYYGVVDSFTTFCQNIKTARKLLGSKIKELLIYAHGDRKGVYLDRENFLSIDADLSKDCIKENLEEDAKIILHSCYTGANTGLLYRFFGNFAEKMSREIPDGIVYATGIPLYASQFEYTSDNKKGKTIRLGPGTVVLKNGKYIK